MASNDILKSFWLISWSEICGIIINYPHDKLKILKLQEYNL